MVSVDIKSLMPMWHKYENYKKLYASQKKMGGGVILTESHEIDLVRWLFGMPITSFSFAGQLSKYKMDVEDTASHIINFKLRKKNFIIQINQSFTSINQERLINIYGDKGSLKLDLNKNSLTFCGINNFKKDFIIKKFKRNQLFLDQIKYINNLSKGIKNEVILDDGLKTLELLSNLKSNTNYI